jgi:hypothetical protein
MSRTGGFLTSRVKSLAAGQNPRARRVGSSVLALFFLLTVLAVVSMGKAAYGEETSSEAFPERLKLYGGYQFLFGLDAKFRFDGLRTGLGSTFDFVNDLGGEENDSMLLVGTLFRFNRHHAIGFSWYDINLKGNRTIDVDLQIDDTIFLANGTIQSKIDLTMYRLFYNWSFYRSDRTELALSLGMYSGDFEATFEGTLILDPGTNNPIRRRSTVREALFAPLPTIGLSVDYKILPRLTANIRFDFFYVDIDEIEGSMAELTVGLEYRVFKHFAVGAAYDRLWLNVDYQPGQRGGWEIDAAWNGGFFYGALYF